MSFELWLEAEYWLPTEHDDPEDEVFNMQVRLPTGPRYALNVWTFKAFARIWRDIQTTEENLDGKYLLPPDLFVERVDRGLLEAIVADLIQRHQLKDEWMVHDD